MIAGLVIGLIVGVLLGGGLIAAIVGYRVVTTIERIARNR